MSAARPDWLYPDPGLDPLGAEFAAAYVNALHDHDIRRMLIASSGGTGGSAGGGRGRGGGGREGRRRATTVLRAQLQATQRRVARLARENAVLKAELAYQKRVYRRGVETTREIEAAQKARLREFQEAERARKTELRALYHFLTKPSERTPYQRRVVSGVTRQIERGERPSIARAAGRKNLRVLRDRYAAYLQGTYGHEFENIRESFLAQLESQQFEQINLAMERQREWVEAGKPIERGGRGLAIAKTCSLPIILLDFRRCQISRLLPILIQIWIAF
jgi:hypothetical protein